LLNVKIVTTKKYNLSLITPWVVKKSFNHDVISALCS